LFSDVERLELGHFGIKVVELKTGFVKSNINSHKEEFEGLPRGSIYEVAKEAVETVMRGDKLDDLGVPAKGWADQVVGDLLGRKPPRVIWRGAQASLAWMGTWFPGGMLDGTVKKNAGFDIVERKLREQG